MASPILSVVTILNEALATAAALTPLIEMHLSPDGRKVTDKDVREALAGKDAALKRLDEEIKRQGG